MEKIVFGTGVLAFWVTKKLSDKGNTVKMINRSGKVNFDLPNNVSVIAGDLSDANFIKKTCKNADTIYHCAMPPMGTWQKLLPPITKAIIDGLSGSNKKIVYGDNLFMYGDTDGKPLTENLPNNPIGIKGKARAEAATELLNAHKNKRFKVAIGRASDLFGPMVINAAIGDLFFKAVINGKTANLLGKTDQPHTFTYVKDFAQGLITLGENDSANGEIWHIPNSKTISTAEFVKIIEKELGTKIKTQSAGTFMVKILGIFMPVMRELKELMYSWNKPYIVKHDKFVKQFGDIHTPVEQSVKETVGSPYRAVLI